MGTRGTTHPGFHEDTHCILFIVHRGQVQGCVAALILTINLVYNVDVAGMHEKEKEGDKGD